MDIDSGSYDNNDNSDNNDNDNNDSNNNSRDNDNDNDNKNDSDSDSYDDNDDLLMKSDNPYLCYYRCFLKRFFVLQKKKMIYQ